MKATEYLATLKHDNGTCSIRLVSLNGKQGAIRQLTHAEGCPERAIISLTEIPQKSKSDEKSNR